MTRLLRACHCTIAIIGAGLPAVSYPQSGASIPAITTAEIDAHLRFLASDLLEGRAPATRGGRLAAEYIRAAIQSYGLLPGVNGSYFQTVPIDVVGADRQSLVAKTSGKATGILRFPEDVVLWAGSAVEQSGANGELIFIGYGSAAPEYKWDDFKGMDVKGKVLLVLVNDPPAPASEPTLFGGKAMTYYGRWTYKFEEAERRGAAGMLIIHTTERAGYPWHTVVGSWAKEQRMLPRDPQAPAPLGVRGWITDSAATALLAQAGLQLADLRKQAESRDFKPIATGINVELGFANKVEHLQSENVIGVIRGTDPKLRDEHVTYSAHFDHLGIGPAVNGDSIYNGALDNASGVADLLAVARVAAQGPKPKRSQIFLFVTAEESGLLGSAFYAANPTVPVTKIVANLNVDGGNLLGRVQDVTALGGSKSSLGPTLTAFIGRDQMRIAPELHPEAGSFYRSDHFSFAKVGIPSLSVGAGSTFVGRPAGWGKQQRDAYTAKNYHQPSDEYKPDFDLTGAVQLSQIVYRFGQHLANSNELPTWNADAEFRAVREASLRSHD
jgi:Zn-dependent M28 family amino/carboxypeptidase